MSGRRASGSNNISLTLGLVVVAIVAVVLGYGMGNYAINMLTTPRQHKTAAKTTPPQVTEQETVPPENQTPAVETAPGIQTPPSDEGQQPVTTNPSLVTNMDDRDSGSQAQPPAGKLFRVQVGAFASKDNAQTMANKLKALGYQCWVTASAPYRVQAGAFSTRDRAEALKKELKEKGFEAVLVVQ